VPSRTYVEKAKARIDEYIAQAKEYLDVRDQRREAAIKLSRDIIKISGWIITDIHKGDLDAAVEKAENMKRIVDEFLEIVRPFPELFYSGMANNALSEYAEAMIFLAIVREEDLPGPDDLGITPVPYLQGLGDVVGELRRLVLENVRLGNFEEAWTLFELMEKIYLSLRTLDYPDAIAPGLRHKADVARRLTDDTKAFLVDLSSRYKLASLLEKAVEKPPSI